MAKTPWAEPDGETGGRTSLARTPRVQADELECQPEKRPENSKENDAVEASRW